MKFIPLIHPILLALYFPLFLFSMNIHSYSYSMLFIPIALITGALIISLFALKLLFANIEKATLFLSANIFVFFTYGYICELLRNFSINLGNIQIGYNKFLLSVCFPLFIGGFFYLFNSKKKLTHINKALTVISLLLFLFPLISISTFGLRHKVGTIKINDLEIDQLVANYKQQKEKDELLPDIFYIIMDNYVRSDVLKEAYNHDNSYFTDFLKQKGFYVADQSYTNYCSTDPSLASSLNFQYLTEVISQINKNSINRRPLIKLKANAKIIRFLKKIGYNYTFLSNGFESIEPKYADNFLSPGWSFGGHFLDEFQNGLINMTPIHYTIRLFKKDPTNYSAQFRKRILFAFDFLANAHKQKGPKFILAHIIAPHEPIVFDENGNELNGILPLAELREKDPVDLVNKYKGEVKYINKKLMFTIDEILAHSIREPIILLQSDHGNSVIIPKGKVPSKDFLHQKHAIINNFYLPGKDYSGLYRDISPVNNFRFILNKHFHANLPYLKDKMYYSKWETPYKVYDITDSLNLLKICNNL